MKYLLYLFTILIIISSASAEIVSIGDFNTVVGSEVTVPVMINGSGLVAGGVVNISFDPSILSVNNVVAGDFGNPVANINNTHGWVKLIAARINKVNKSQAVLANLVFNGSKIGITGMNLTYAILNNESGQLFTPTIKNGSIEVIFSLDETPLSSITDLRSTVGDSWINWTWTNPVDADFNHTIIYLDGAIVADFTENHFNATGLQPATIHTISTHTADINGKINQTWVNNTALTAADLSNGLNINVYKPENFSVYPAGETLKFNIEVTDPAGNPVDSGTSAYADLSGPNDASRQIILTKNETNFTGEYIVQKDDPRGMWIANITAYNTTNSGRVSVKIFIIGAYIIQPGTNSPSYVMGDTANFSASVVKPGNPSQILTDNNLSLNMTVYHFNNSTPVLETVEMLFNDTAGLFYGDVDTGLLGSGLFKVVFDGKDTFGNVENASMMIGVSEDFSITIGTDMVYYDRGEPVNIFGTVKYDNNSPISNANISIQLNLQGYKRAYSVITNETGSYNYTFRPFAAEAGNYSVKATVSNIELQRTAQSDFTIYGLYLAPESAIVNMVENSTQKINFTLYNLGDTKLTGINPVIKDLDISDTVTATINPADIPSELLPYNSTLITVQINGGTPVPDKAVFQLEVTTDQNSNEVSDLNVNLFSPTPIVKAYPENIQIGLNKNQTVIKTVTISNIGYGSLKNITLHQLNNSWSRITSNTSLGDLKPGENASFDVHINSYNVDLGTYYDTVNITSDNYDVVKINLTAYVTDLNNGSLLFHVRDALEKELQDANISLINQETFEEFDITTNSSGYALLNNLPIGRYIFEVSSDGTNTLPQMGIVEVEAMETPKLIEISLYMSFIDFDWEVIPTSIEDYYNVILRMRFETDVPIPLLLAFPPNIEYNMAPGEEKTGTFTLYNVGLVSIYNVTISPIKYNGIILDPMITDIGEIKGKSNIQIPYKIKLASNAASCQELSGKINIRGKYLHFINNHEVISYIGTTVPVLVRTPFNDSCSIHITIPNFCFNIDGIKLGNQTENLSVNPSTIWFITGEESSAISTSSLLLENISIATNHNPSGDIKFSKALGMTLSFGVEDAISLLIPGASLSFDVIGDGANIPYFNGVWSGVFDPDIIVPEQTSNLSIERQTSGAGLTLPEIIGGGIGFQFGNTTCYNCIWIIPMGGVDISTPHFGLPNITIYHPHVRLIEGTVGGGGTFCWTCFPDVFVVPTLPHFGGTTYVPWDWPEWVWNVPTSDPFRPTPKPKVTQTIHEIVELSISQNVTMERDAFWAGLGIRNRMPDKNINDVRVDLQIKGNGVSANDKFFIQAPRLKGINSLDGSGVISSSSLVKAQWLMIPKPGAGGANPEGTKYNISANISYSVDGVNFEISTQEVEILVKPQPEVVLDYFIPSDVIANKPFKLAVKVTNEGYGPARNFSIETAQPVIYYNPSGLLIDFEIIRSQLQGQERSTSLKIDFGNIEPAKSKLAWWDMVTSIDGTFTEFTGEYTHTSELGGMETSLIKKINTYIIQKQIGTGEIGFDFLANSKSDENHYMLFNSSNGNSTFVNRANYTVVNMPTPKNPILDVSMEDYTGQWTIVSIENPYNEDVPIEKVFRTRDGTEIPSYNYWIRSGRILIVDHYDVGFDGNYSIIFKYSNLVPVITTNRTMYDGSTVVEENISINFNGSDSYDEFGSIISYNWEFGDGTEAIGDKVDHIFTKMGEYQINLTITNNAGVSNKTNIKVIATKQIIELEVVQVNFESYDSGNIPLDISREYIKNIMKDITEYYYKSSYGSIYLNLQDLSKITIDSKSHYDTLKKPDDPAYIFNIYEDAIMKLGIANYRDIDNNKIYILVLNQNDYVRQSAFFDHFVLINSNDNDRGLWAHEIGHILGHVSKDSITYRVSGNNDHEPIGELRDLYFEPPHGDFKGNDHGEVYYWDLMSMGNLANPATDLSSFSKLWLNWLIPTNANFGNEYGLKPIEKNSYKDPVYVFKDRGINYILESRDLAENKVTSGDRVLEDGVIIYKVENLDLFSMKDRVNQNWRINYLSPIIDKIARDNSDPTLTAGSLIKLIIEIPSFVKFQIISESNTPYYSPTIKIGECDVCKSIKGLILTTASSALFSSQSQIRPIDNITSPDIDLHAYDNKGLHVGMNYSNGEYEIQIPSAFASGDLLNGEEWIFVPTGTEVKYYIDSHDVRQYLNENPEIDPANATMNYSITSMEYGENPQRLELPDGNWTVSNRTISEPQNYIIEPGVIKETVPEPPASITNLTFEAGATWLNFTWLNPSDPDFSRVMLYLNGSFKTILPASQNYFNFTGLTPDTEYELGTHTVDNSGNVNETWVNATARTAPLASESIQVINPSVNPAIILNDNGRARPPGTNITSLNVTVTGNVASVSVDLSPIGGSAVALMTRIIGTDNYTIITNATSGINLTHYLVVTATDTKGNFNNSVGITLTVLLRGDIVRDNKIDLKDLLYMRRHLAGLETSINKLVADIQPAIGDDSVDLKDLLYLRRHLAGLEPVI